ncbi:hypothetical protein [Photobacterium carnosum]|uniref:Y-family DNA polymerase n=1 Tax=Photobacterium carnosum TaxID=2023717 RepID=UPI0039F65538|nr:hypothetical protein [Photobacterium carnosum]
MFQPELRHRPIAVVTSVSGIIIALNKAASAIGVERFEPIFKYKNIIQNGRLIAAEANFNLFGYISNAMHTEIERLVPDVYRYSIDEAFSLRTGRACLSQ